jgi:hypothetical protein
MLFRGPRRQMQDRYLAFLGATETYGRFVETPFSAQIERRLGVECVNFGAVNAGLDLYLNEPVILTLAEWASLKVVQVMGAQNMSNRYYAVHPRRNDRFLRAGERLETLYPEVDFTEFHFNRHLLTHLEELSPDRFAAIVEELKYAWVARMKQMLTQLRGGVVLLWFARDRPPQRSTQMSAADPLFVDREMIEMLRTRVAHVVEVIPSEVARVEGTQGLIFADHDTCAAHESLGLRAQSEVAETLAPLLAEMLVNR